MMETIINGVIIIRSKFKIVRYEKEISKQNIQEISDAPNASACFSQKPGYQMTV